MANQMTLLAALCALFAIEAVAAYGLGPYGMGFESG